MEEEREREREGEMEGEKGWREQESGVSRWRSGEEIVNCKRVIREERYNELQSGRRGEDEKEQEEEERRGCE